jgi:signal transduction histidine kinase
MRQAHDSGNSAHGIELGPLGTFTLRVVRPWRINGELVGYLELGEEIDHIIEDLKKIDQTRLNIAIKKEFLSPGYWQERENMPEHANRWKRSSDYIINNGVDAKLSQELKNGLHMLLENQQPMNLSIGQHYYNAQPFPLMDAGQRQVGSMIIMHDITNSQQSLIIFILVLTGTAFTVTSILMAFFYQYISRIEKRMAYAQKAIEEESLQKIDALANSNIIKTRFMANMSHEIRTPMNGILGMLQLIQESSLTGEQKNYVEIAHNSAQHLLTLLNDILDSSKLESDQFTLEQVAYDIRELSKNTVASVSAIAQQKGLVVNCDVHADTPNKIVGDPTRMRQILSNLLNNATKFTAQGAITLSVRPVQAMGKQNTLQFQVSDTGIGIAANSIHHIFDSYSQADESVTRKYGGTGLGLAIAKHLVEKMGGQISVTSTPGDGSTFTFLVPTEIAQPQYIPAQPSARTVDELRILIIGHNLNNCLSFSGMLNELGIRNETSTDMGRCMHTLHSAAQTGDPFQVVITDTTGLSKQELQLAQGIRQDAALGETHLILLLNTGFRGDAYMARKAGYQAYLSYPIDKHLLNNCIDTVLQMPFKQAPGIIVTRHLLEEHKIDQPLEQIDDEAPSQASCNRA